MNDMISRHILKLRVLSEVPCAEYSDLRPPKDPTNQQERGLFFRLLRKSAPDDAAKAKPAQPAKRTMRFNAAAWITFLKSPEKPVSLWLNYKDEQGVKSVLIDETHAGAKGSTMLSGHAEIKIRGELLYIHACVGGLKDEDMFRVDELYVQRSEESTAVKQRHSA